MRLTQLFTHTVRQDPKDETTVNAKFLTRGGFIFKNSAGIYSYLPLGWRVMQKIANIVREEMNAIGGQELLLQALIEKSYLQPTGRWGLDVGYKAKTDDEKEANFTLGWTHEEVLSAIAQKFVNSYKDLPLAVYQIQTKFRNEPRAKAGLLRGREFMMKDLYSYHASQEDFERFYDKVAKAYHKVFNRCGLKAIYTLAAGGVFTKSFTHEFQVIAPVGEDEIYVCLKCEYAENKEISKLKQDDDCPKCGGKIVLHKSIEVGNIFPQGTRYSEAFNLYYADDSGRRQPVIQGSYGIGISRVMGTIVEVHHDERGIIWPESVAPYTIYLVELKSKNEKVKTEAGKLYKQLTDKGIEVIYDDRDDVSPGEKLADADLLGCPTRIVVSGKTLEGSAVEVKKRQSPHVKLVPISQVGQKLIRTHFKSRF